MMKKEGELAIFPSGIILKLTFMMASLLIAGQRRVMKREEYLTKQEQYSLVRCTGKSWTGNLLSIRLLPNRLSFSRYGFVISKRVGKAVIRNRIKRLLREILRQTLLKPGWDIVFYARPAAAGASFSELKNLILSLLSQVQLLMENYEKVSPETN